MPGPWRHSGVCFMAHYLIRHWILRTLSTGVGTEHMSAGQNNLFISSRLLLTDHEVRASPASVSPLWRSLAMWKWSAGALPREVKQISELLRGIFQSLCLKTWFQSSLKNFGTQSEPVTDSYKPSSVFLWRRVLSFLFSSKTGRATLRAVCRASWEVRGYAEGQGPGYNRLEFRPLSTSLPCVK